jgi:thiopurine S-methyltransferase
MEQGFWQERWEQGQIGFHQEHANPLLERFWANVGVQGGRVLVPLCGKSLDLKWLADRGHEVVGVEFVSAAVEAYFVERGIEPLREEIAGFPLLRGAGVSLLVGDFFRVHTGVTGWCDAIYDRAAWVAIAEQDRARYVAQLRSLLRPGGRVLLVNFVHDLGSGPPHSIEETELRARWQGFSLELLFEHDILDDEPRFRQRGATRFVEQAWLGVAMA